MIYSTNSTQNEGLMEVFYDCAPFGEERYRLWRDVFENTNLTALVTLPINVVEKFKAVESSYSQRQWTIGSSDLIVAVSRSS